MTKHAKVKTRSRARSTRHNRVRSAVRRRSTTSVVRRLDERAFAALYTDRKMASRAAAETPDVAIHFALVGHGYEARLFINGNYVGSQCRDFDGTYKVDELKRTLLQSVFKAINNWRMKL